MSFPNFSELKAQVYSYLGFRGVGASEETDALISNCLEELEKCAQFNYLYRAFEEPPTFLNKEPYATFLKNTQGVILSVMTLGAEADRRIAKYMRTDMGRAVVLDACASAYLEQRADAYEKTIGDNLTYRFCPGYNGSSVEDLKDIFAVLRPERIGVTLTEENFMLPAKSMAGVIGVGKHAKKTCGDCFMLPHCKFREEGKTCYSLENK